MKDLRIVTYKFLDVSHSSDNLTVDEIKAVFDCIHRFSELAPEAQAEVTSAIGHRFSKGSQE